MEVNNPLENRLLALLTADTYCRTADLAACLPDVPVWLTRQTLDRLAAEGRAVRRRGGKLWRLAPPALNGDNTLSHKQEKSWSVNS